MRPVGVRQTCLQREAGPLARAVVAQRRARLQALAAGAAQAEEPDALRRYLARETRQLCREVRHQDGWPGRLSRRAPRQPATPEATNELHAAPLASCSEIEKAGSVPQSDGLVAPTHQPVNR